MQVIKKYANRKLYHTNQKQYITLEGIARLVQQGELVQILDNESGEDITASILAQVVLQARGRNGAPIPASLLTGMIQLGGDTIASLRRTLFASLGGGDLVETEIGRRIDHLIADGTLSLDEGARWRMLLLRREFAITADDQLADHEADIPNRNDVVRLHNQVDALAALVDQLLRKQ